MCVPVYMMTFEYMTLKSGVLQLPWKLFKPIASKVIEVWI